MNIQNALKSQYHAALAMLRETIQRCPDNLWTAGQEPRPFWRIAYHALFYTHLYLQPNEAAFQPWEKSREECQFLDRLPWHPHDMPKTFPPYSQQEILEYWRLCDAIVDESVDRLDLASQECGFPWYSMPKLDHQIMNIRHVQQHTGQLSEILNQAGVDTDWIGTSG